MDTNKIFMRIIPQVVKVRKYEIDNKSLVDTLRFYRKRGWLTNKTISSKLNYPLTLVEHWFRTDKYFAIPDAEIWFELKKLLEIQTDKFDMAITQFEYRFGTYEKSDRCYCTYGIAPCVTCEDGIKIIEE